MFKKKSSEKSMSNNTFEKWAKNMKIIQKRAKHNGKYRYEKTP